MASLDYLSFKSIFRNSLFKDHDEDQVNLFLMRKSGENNKEDSIRKKWYIDSGCSKHEHLLILKLVVQDVVYTK